MSLVARFINLYRTKPAHAIGIAGIILCPVGVLVGLAFGIYEEAWEREMREREILIEALVEGEEVIAFKRATLITEAERLRRRVEAVERGSRPDGGDRGEDST